MTNTRVGSENIGYPDLSVFEPSKLARLQQLDQCVYVGPEVFRWLAGFVWVRRHFWRHQRPSEAVAR